MIHSFVYPHCCCKMCWAPLSRHGLAQEGTCEMEGGYYCQEEMTKLLLDDPNCFMQFMQPAEHVTCSKKCVLQWKKAEEKMPKCMKSLEQNRKKSFRVTVDFVKGIMRAGKDRLKAKRRKDR